MSRVTWFIGTTLSEHSAAWEASRENSGAGVPREEHGDAWLYATRGLRLSLCTNKQRFLFVRWGSL